LDVVVDKRLWARMADPIARSVELLEGVVVDLTRMT
jgi:hypothetical protein